MHLSTLSMLAGALVALIPAALARPLPGNDEPPPRLLLEPAPGGSAVRLRVEGGPPAGRAWLFDVDPLVPSEAGLRAPGALVGCLSLDAWGEAELELAGAPPTALRALVAGRGGSLAGARWSDALAPGTVPTLAGLAGEMLVVEFLNDPTTVADGDGEWVEVFNATPNPIDLEGWTLADLGSDNTVLANGGQGIVVAPYEFFVLGRNDDFFSNGGVDVDFEYTGMTLSNTADEVVLLRPDGSLADQVVYDSSWPSEAGRAVNLSRAFFDPLENDDAASWCLSWSPINTTAPDRGTPGERNDRCPNFGG